MNRYTVRLLSLVGLIAILAFAFSSDQGNSHSVIDLRAALLVLIAPLFVLGIFAKERIAFKLLKSRIDEMRAESNDALIAHLIRETERFQPGQAVAQAVTVSEKASDSFLRYGGHMLSARFDRATLEELLAKKISAEDAQWQTLYNLAGFLAKMAPYFGMLATVAGMIQVLNHMTDFSRISGSMALAMQGTLFGLMSFTLLFSPLQKWILGCREMFYLRNELISDWVLGVAANHDVVAIAETLRARSMNSHEVKA